MRRPTVIGTQVFIMVLCCIICQIQDVDSLSDEDVDSEMNEDMLEQAKQLLKLTYLVEKYPAVVERRVAGLVYVLTGGGISLTALIFTSIMPYIGDLTQNMFIILIFVISSLFVSWLVAFRLIVPITRSYPRTQGREEMSTRFNLYWLFLAIFIIVSSVYSFGTNQPNLFPLFIQILLTFGMFVNYAEAQKSTNAFVKEHLIFGIFTMLSIIPILLFPAFGFLVIIIADIGGIYAMGVYMLITAEQLLLESAGRG